MESLVEFIDSINLIVPFINFTDWILNIQVLGTSIFGLLFGIAMLTTIMRLIYGFKIHNND